MLSTFLKKMNLCRIEELESANNTIAAQKSILTQCNERIADLKDQLKFSQSQSNSLASKNEEYLSDIRNREEEIARLKDELADEKYRYEHWRELNSKELEEAKAALEVYKSADIEGRITVNICKPGSSVYWISKGFDSTVKPYAVEFEENTGCAIIELTVSKIITDTKGTMVFMDASGCIENIPSFHIYDFGKCIFTNIDDAKAIFKDIVESSTPVERRVSKSPEEETVDTGTIDEESTSVEIEVEGIPAVECPIPVVEMNGDLIEEDESIGTELPQE